MRVLLIPGLLSAIIAISEYLVYGPTPHLHWYPITLLGLPGALVAQVIMAILIGGHGGGPLYYELLISVPVNFCFYAGLLWMARGIWRFMKREMR